MGTTATESSAPAQRLQRRHAVVLLCFFATLICYIDRVNISVAIIPMAEQFGWSDSQRGLVLSSFFVGYLVTQMLGGWLAAKLGGKAVLGFGVLWWSLFTLLTPLSAVGSFPLLIATRILMGVGEGVAFPATYNLLGRWVPASERSRAAAFNLSAIPMGTLLAITLTPLIALSLGWPWVFYLFGGVGFVWFVFWWRIAGDRPAVPVDSVEDSVDTQSVNTQAEAPIPYGKLLRSGPVWAIIVAHFCNNWGLYVMLSWLPSYFASQMGVDLRSVWIYVAPPWVAMFVGGNFAGWIADRIHAAGWSMTAVRKLMQTIGFAAPAIAIAILANVESALTAVIVLTIAQTLGSCTFAGFASNHLDISPTHAGVIFGISNTGATIPGIIGVALTGFLVESTGSYASAFYLTAAVYAVGLLVYLLFGSGRQVVE